MIVRSAGIEGNSVQLSVGKDMITPGSRRKEIQIQTFCLMADHVGDRSR